MLGLNQRPKDYESVAFNPLAAILRGNSELERAPLHERFAHGLLTREQGKKTASRRRCRKWVEPQGFVQAAETFLRAGNLAFLVAAVAFATATVSFSALRSSRRCRASSFFWAS